MALKNQVLHNPIIGQTLRFIQTADDTAGQLLEMEATLRPHSIEPAAHFHPQQDEDFRVLTGELTIVLDGQTRVLRAGDTLHVPRNQVHSMWNGSDAETIVNWQVRPALNTEQFFETVVGLVNAGKTDAKGMPSLLQTALMAKHFANVFRLASPPVAVQDTVFSILTPFARMAGYRPTYER